MASFLPCSSKEIGGFPRRSIARLYLQWARHFACKMCCNTRMGIGNRQSLLRRAPDRATTEGVVVDRLPG